ncbi:doublesex- and mab-3-related transcription factor 2-like [Cryptotermes secundus]|uniref:doublesex- and mab-3-related transcription factor 2-like n=1 Tax=Cryptotermes secundus TaxID=105785 RepID=UPI000CD7C170|nr:doublesex- and mab-3-related transcription factor 2-like [Cryptotermes secundus]
MEKEGTLLPPRTSGATGNSLRAKASSSGTTETSTHTPNSYPTCSRCRNHWLKIRVKGHKRFCKYRDCTCEKCSLVAEGQKISALRMAVWRAQVQDEGHVAKQVNQYPKESISVTRRASSALDSGLKARTGNLQSTTPVTPETDSHSMEGSNYSLSAGGRTTFTTPSAPMTCSRSFGESSDSLRSSESFTVTQATALLAPAAPATNSLATEGTGYTPSTGGRTLSVEGCCKALYSSRSPLTDTCGRTLPIAPFPSAAPWVYSTQTEHSSYSLSTGDRMLPTAPFAPAVPWMDSSLIDWSCFAESTAGRSLPTAPSADTNPSQLPQWCGQEFQNRGSMTNVSYEMLLNQYYLNLRCLIKPH